MIIVKLTGGMGNQMFQYAAARRLAELNSTVLKLDLSYYNENKLRTYSLSCFKLGCEEASIDEINTALAKTSKLNRFINKNFIDKPVYKCIKEPNFHFQYYSEIETASSNTYLDGNWQSEKYFEDIAEIIRKDFKFKNELTLENNDWVNQIKAENSVSIHVRRADYVQNEKTHEFHGVCSLSYYKNCVQYIQNKTVNPIFFIFSDDSVWAREHLKIDGSPMVFVSNKFSDDYSLDMRLMSLCNHNIIANSSFSWWGAWLNTNPDKIVLAPEKWLNPYSKWFLDYKINTSDILPKSWIKIKE